MAAFRFSYSIRARLPGVPEAPAGMGAKFLRTLDALSCVDPIFDDWYFIDCRAMSSIPLVKARPRIAALIKNNVSRDDWGKAEPENGYHAAAIARNSVDPRNMGISIHAGGQCQGEMMLDAGRSA